MAGCPWPGQSELQVLTMYTRIVLSLALAATLLTIIFMLVRSQPAPAAASEDPRLVAYVDRSTHLGFFSNIFEYNFETQAITQLTLSLNDDDGDGRARSASRPTTASTSSSSARFTH